MIGVAPGEHRPSPPPYFAGLPFTGPYLLAPMEGVTEPCFRDVVLELHEPTVLGGAFTEFVRVVRDPLPLHALVRELGPRRYPSPVGLQLMGSDLGSLAETAARAEASGAPLIDLNFGCPAKGALRGCAGAGLLEDPPRIESIVAAVRAAVQVPVTAKIRAGGENDDLIEDLAKATEAGGAALLTVHCRTRAEAYRDCADWRRLERAVAAVGIPVCGNGGVERHADLARLLKETGCRFAMVGRAALGDPWIFSGEQVPAPRAARFLLDYADRLVLEGDARPGRISGRIKQLFRYWVAGDLLQGAPESWLREQSPERLVERLVERAELAPGDPAPACLELVSTQS